MSVERRPPSLLLAGLLCASLGLGCGPGDGGDVAVVGGYGGGVGGSGAVIGDTASGGTGSDGGATAIGGGSNGGDTAIGGGGASDPGLDRRIDEAIASIQSDTCFAQDDTSQCEWADYAVGPAQFDMAKSTGEAVLVVDDFGAGLFPEFVRYRNRLLGFYDVDGDQVAAQVISVHLPKRLGDALVSFAGPEFIPANALTKVVQVVGPAYDKLNLLYYGHGGVVFGHLVELIPEQPLVLLEMSHLFGIPPAVCLGIDDQSLAAAREHYAAVAASLRQVMTEHNVRFVNASFGSTAPTLATDWSRTCGNTVPNSDQLDQLLHIYDPIYDLLFNSEGVIAAHAAANLGSPADYPFDQVSAKYPNRTRVGFFSSLSSGLDESGRGTVNMAEQFPNDGDADVYLNWGCEAGEIPPVCAEPHYRIAGEFGLGMGTVPLMSSSYVNPLGLARLINLRYANHSAEPMSNALVQVLKQELTPSLCGATGDQPCVHQDPITHHQLEFYRLGYE